MSTIAPISYILTVLQTLTCLQTTHASLKSWTHAPSAFDESTLPKEPECHASAQQQEQDRKPTVPLDDPLQDEQDPEEQPQTETLNNLAPNLAKAIMLMTHLSITIKLTN